MKNIFRVVFFSFFWGVVCYFYLGLFCAFPFAFFLFLILFIASNLLVFLSVF